MGPDLLIIVRVKDVHPLRRAGKIPRAVTAHKSSSARCRPRSREAAAAARGLPQSHRTHRERGFAGAGRRLCWDPSFRRLCGSAARMLQRVPGAAGGARVEGGGRLRVAATAAAATERPILRCRRRGAQLPDLLLQRVCVCPGVCACPRLSASVCVGVRVGRWGIR
eukprot:gene16376-biopygen8246